MEDSPSLHSLSDSENSSDEEELDLQSPQAKILESPSEFLSFACKHKKVKVLSETSPLDPRLTLKDISLHKKGPLEDKLYARFPFFYYNIRRGNTILEIYEQGEDVPKLLFCRRGLRKFYDLTLEMLDFTRGLANNQGSLPFLTGFQKRMRTVIFQRIEDLVLKGQISWKSLQIHKIYKENGEHCQISYVAVLDSWLIASKNVTILIKTPSDLALYNKERHYWPRLIAETWFETLGKHSQGQVARLKQELAGLTLLGEHCGHPKHTHIIRYSEVEIIFYAIVENSDPRAICLSPERSFAIFKDFGLKSSRMGSFEDFSGFLNKMEALLREIEGSPCEGEGEGSVVYITHGCEVVSMSKMKTYEYLIFRGLREHLKKQVQKPTVKRREKFNEELRAIFKPRAMQKPQGFYEELGKVAFGFVENPENKVSFNDVYYNFVGLLGTFLSKVQDFKPPTAKKPEKPGFQVILVTPPLFLGPETNEILKKGLKIEEITTNWHEEKEASSGISLCLLHMIPRLTGKNPSKSLIIIAGFSAKMIEKTLDFMDGYQESNLQKNPQLFAFLNKTDRKSRSQKVEFLRKKIPLFIDNLKQNSYEFEVFEDEELIPPEFIKRTLAFLKKSRGFELPSPEDKPPCRSELLALIPIGIPGMGKSFLAKVLQKASGKLKFDRFVSISIDRIRSEVQKEKGPAGVELDYHKSVKETSRRFYSELRRTLEELSEQGLGKTLLYLDKNHTPTILDTTFECLYGGYKGLKVRTVALIPSILKPMSLKGRQYPFSWEFILACLSRCLNRENHETLDQDPVYRVKVLLKFLQIFRDVKIRSLEGFERFLEVPFVKESGLGMSSGLERLVELVGKSMEMIPQKGEPNDSPVFCEIVEEFYRVGGKLVEEYEEEEFEDRVLKALGDI